MRTVQTLGEQDAKLIALTSRECLKNFYAARPSPSAWSMRIPAARKTVTQVLSSAGHKIKPFGYPDTIYECVRIIYGKNTPAADRRRIVYLHGAEHGCA
jgi:hypothetical protein